MATSWKTDLAAGKFTISPDLRRELCQARDAAIDDRMHDALPPRTLWQKSWDAVTRKLCAKKPSEQEAADRALADMYDELLDVPRNRR